ncbi:MAG: ribosome maturation factor RimM [Candidatus Acidiferrales bacterium]
MNTQHSPKAQHVTVARIVRPHGVRGEVAAEILTDFPERLTKLTSVELWNGHSAPQRVAVRKCWLSHSRGGQAIFHFATCDSVDDAKKLVGLEVQVPLTDRVKLPAGSYYISDLVGCEVREKGGAEIGRVREVEINGDDVSGTPLLVVDAKQGEILIPLAQEICVNVDIAARRIDVVLPEGLLDLNTK